ncbi:MAG TPA: hypothetical protein VNC50_16045 [Planctomycetia bacterium]|nr:hypothetical protein [Planctomycetia bacterium]
MRDKRLRSRIAREAARLMYHREESEYGSAKRKAARSLGLRFRPKDLPSSREIENHLETIVKMLGIPPRVPSLREAKVETLRWLRRFGLRSPLAILPIPAPSAGVPEIECEGALEPLLAELRAERVDYRLESPREDSATATVFGRLPVRLTARRSSSGRPAIGAAALEDELRAESPDSDLDSELLGVHAPVDRLFVLEFLAQQLEGSEALPPAKSDGLRHALEVFTLAQAERPYDEEFLTAALFHDLGGIFDRRDPLPQTLAVLDGLVTERTLRLISAATGAENAAADADAREDARLLRSLIDAANKSPLEPVELPFAIAVLRALDDGSAWEPAP